MPLTPAEIERVIVACRHLAKDFLNAVQPDDKIPTALPLLVEAAEYERLARKFEAEAAEYERLAARLKG